MNKIPNPTTCLDELRDIVTSTSSAFEDTRLLSIPFPQRQYDGYSRHHCFVILLGKRNSWTFDCKFRDKWVSLTASLEMKGGDMVEEDLGRFLYSQGDRYREMIAMVKKKCIDACSTLTRTKSIPRIYYEDDRVYCGDSDDEGDTKKTRFAPY